MKTLLKIFFILIWMTIQSCDSDSFSDVESGQDPFLENLANEYKEITIEYKIHPASYLVYEPRMLFTKDNCDGNSLIIIDHSTNTIQLAVSDGQKVYETGGEGSGPEEFQSIIWAHVDSDNYLYVVDGIQFRISIFEIKEDRLNYIKSVSYKNPSNYFLTSVYVTDHGNYGVYQETEGFFSPENRFYLYSLDETFSPIEQLIEMPGHDRQKIESSEFTFYTPNKYRFQTHWSFDDGWFYFAKSDTTMINRYHLQTGKSEQISFLQMDKRPNTYELQEAVKEYYNSEDVELYLETLDKIDHLPLFNSLLVRRNHIYLTILPTPGEDGMSLVLNLKTQEIEYFRHPQEFVPKAVCGKSVYGINFRVSEPYQIVQIKIYN
jgi:hypothetical protein